MSRAHSSFIPAEQVENATDWAFSAVDQAALRFAAKLKAQALEEERARNDTERKAGYNEGYAAGFAQGHAQATMEGDKRINDYIATQGQDAAERMVALFESAQSQLQQTEPVIAQGVLALACDIARQVLRRELQMNPASVQPVVQEALGLLLADSKAAVVRLHPHDAEVVGSRFQQAFPQLQISVLPDGGITAGGCLVESGTTVVDATVERRWAQVVSSLGLDAAWALPVAPAPDVPGEADDVL